MIDTHAHLDALRAGPATPPSPRRPPPASSASSRSAASRRSSWPPAIDGVWAIVGWHPHEAAEADVEAAAAAAGRIRGWSRWARSASTSTATTPPPDDQRRVFAEQIELANELGLPLVIHTRDADHETFPMLERARGARGAALLLLAAAARRGRRARLPAVVRRQRHVPQARWSCSRPPRGCRTTCCWPRPTARYLAPVPLRGRRNSPANVLHTLAFLAGLRGVDAGVPGRADRAQRGARVRAAVSTAALALALSAALVHALWNVLVGGARDPRPAAAVAMLASVAVGAAAGRRHPGTCSRRRCPGRPPRPCWSWPTSCCWRPPTAAPTSAVIYPIARGAAPVLVLAGGDRDRRRHRAAASWPACCWWRAASAVVAGGRDRAGRPRRAAGADRGRTDRRATRWSTSTGSATPRRCPTWSW